MALPSSYSLFKAVTAIWPSERTYRSVTVNGTGISISNSKSLLYTSIPGLYTSET